MLVYPLIGHVLYVIIVYRCTVSLVYIIVVHVMSIYRSYITLHVYKRVDYMAYIVLTTLNTHTPTHTLTYTSKHTYIVCRTPDYQI